MKNSVKNIKHPAQLALSIAEANLQGHIHANLRCKPTTKTHDRKWWKLFNELQDKRDTAREEVLALVDSGEIPTLSRLERLTMTAQGHPDNQSTQAARRILLKQYGKVVHNDEYSG